MLAHHRVCLHQILLQMLGCPGRVRRAVRVVFQADGYRDLIQELPAQLFHALLMTFIGIGFEDESQIPLDEDDFVENSQEECDEVEQFSLSQLSKRFKPEDKSTMRKLVMRKIDALFLAPQKSPMFKRKFKSTPLADGTYQLRKNPEIKMKLFKQYVDPIIRRLLRKTGKSHRHDLFKRYFAASLFITTRRRSNHTQSWRIHNCPKQLIYGGTALYEAKYGRLPSKSKATVKKKLFEAVSEQPQPLPATPPQPPSSTTAQRSSSTTAQRPSSPLTLQAPDFCDVQPTADENDVPYPEKFTCVKCRESFPIKEGFPTPTPLVKPIPKDFFQSLFCQPCWRKHVQEDLMPRVREMRGPKKQAGKRKSAPSDTTSTPPKKIKESL